MHLQSDTFIFSIAAWQFTSITGDTLIDLNIEHMFQNMVILLFQHMLNKASRIQGVIHSVRKKNFPKN